jgi:C4-dicarboxylate-specific signal transduction histidine kinase
VPHPSADWPLERLDALNRLTTAARLLSTAVHETSNSLQVMSGNAEMLEAQAGSTTADPEKMRNRAQAIKSHADRAGARLRALSALAAPSPGAKRPVDLRRLAEQAVDLRRYTLARARVAVAIEGEAVTVVADDLALTRVLANLVLNAEVALAGQPSPAITVRVALAGAEATVTVADNGPGLAADRGPSLFDPFVGTAGCGLAVSRFLAEGQGGRLDLDAGHTPGAAFVLGLPAR